MKRLLTFALSLAIILNLGIVVFAADETGVGAGDYSNDVTGSYVAGTTGYETVFSVDITWTAMSFTYHAAKEPAWDAENHIYTDSVSAYWEGEGTITVTNHSNVRISAVPSYAPADGFDTADMVFSTNDLSVASAESGSAQTGTITVTPSGYLPEMDAAAKIGTITVTIAEDPDATLEDANELLAMIKSLEREISSYYPDASEDATLRAAHAELESDIASLRTTVTVFVSAFDSTNQESNNSYYLNHKAQYRQILADFNAWKELYYPPES